VRVTGRIAALGVNVSSTDWSKLAEAPSPSHFADFAKLAATVAKRYPDVIIGLVVAWEKHYITVALLKGLLSALLAILLWWLPLLGVNLHIH